MIRVLVVTRWRRIFPLSPWLAPRATPFVLSLQSTPFLLSIAVVVAVVGFPSCLGAPGACWLLIRGEGGELPLCSHRARKTERERARAMLSAEDKATHLRSRRLSNFRPGERERAEERKRRINNRRENMCIIASGSSPVYVERDERGATGTDYLCSSAMEKGEGTGQ